MDPVRFSVARPYTVAVAVIVAMLASWFSYRRIPVQLKPTVDTPFITVMTAYRGAGPVEVEEAVTRKIEDLLQSVEGLEKLTSSSIEGLSTVVLEYHWGIDKDHAVIDVINKLSQIEDLPEDAEQPVVSLTGQWGEEAAMWIRTVSRLPVDRVRRWIEDVAGPRIERVPGVSGLLVVGGEQREIRVLLDPDRLAARRIGFEEVLSALRRDHLDLRGGTLETATRQLVVRTEGRTPVPRDLEEVVLRRGPEGTIRVGDVATVVDGYRETTAIVHGDGEDIVAIGVRRQVGANVVTMIEGVDRELEELNRRFAADGVDLRLEGVYRDTTYLEQALAFVKSNLLWGSVLSIAALLLFLRSLRSILIITVSLPISLATVFLVLEAFDRTLNVVSLAGLAFASGIVVDNAIVVLENTFRKLEQGMAAREAAVEGGREVWGGVLAATLTTTAVFLPIVAIEEEAGQLFTDLALAIAASVVISLVVALTVVPCLAALLYRRRTERAEWTLGPLTRVYGRAVDRLTSPEGPNVLEKLALCLVFVAGSILTLRIIPPVGYLPAGNTNLIFYFGQSIPGERPETLAAHLAPLERWIQAQPESGRYFTVVAPLFQGGGVILKPEHSSGPNLDSYQQRMMPVCFSIPGFRFLIPLRANLFQDSGKQFTLEISGPSLEVLSGAANALQQKLAAWPGVQPGGIQSDYVEGRPELRIQIDPHRSAEAGLTVHQVGTIVETAFAGTRIGTFSDGGRDYDVSLVVPQARIESSDQLETLPVVTPRGALTSLGAVAAVETKTGPQSIQRLERERAITLTVNLTPDAVLQAVMDDVESRAVEPVLADLPPGYRIDLGGSADKLSRTLKALTGGLWLAVLVTYLLLVALFRSWITPIVILVSVPPAMTGGLLGITLAHRYSADATFDVLSILGLVILTGNVVSNAILIVHQANNLREQGYERRRALSESARTRLRPILMTVLTTVTGMIPLAFGRGAGAELYQGLAIVITGGLVLSTLFTLFFLPALMSLGWDVEERLRGRGQPAVVAVAEPARP